MSNTDKKTEPTNEWVVDNLETAQKLKELIESPPKPNEALKKALRDYEKNAPQALKDFKLF